MARIVFFLIIFALIVVLVIFISKTIKLSHEKKTSYFPKDRKQVSSIADELLKLQNLKEEGIISEKEFEELKKKLMD